MNTVRIPVFNPVIIDLPGPLAVSWYGLMYLLGFVFVYIFVRIHIHKNLVRLSTEHFVEILIRAFIGVLVGGRLSFVLFVNPSYYFSNPLKIFAVWEGGMYFFGGLAAALIIPYFYIRKQGMNLFDIADLVIIPAPIGLAFGRLGNFINGEFWGKPSASRLGFIFDSVPQSDWYSTSDPIAQEMISVWNLEATGELINLPRHPVQLYELVLEGIVLFLILLLFREIGDRKPRGSVASLFMLGYGVFRFWIEFYREPVSHSRYLFGDWFTLAMLFTIPMVLLGIFGLVYSFKLGQTNLIYGDPKAQPKVGNSKNSSSKLTSGSRTSKHTASKKKKRK